MISPEMRGSWSYRIASTIVRDDEEFTLADKGPTRISVAVFLISTPGFCIAFDITLGICHCDNRA